MKMLNMTVAERAIPLPARPGTIWTTDHPANTCLNCGQSYGGHGAPEDVADELRIDRSKRDLICPASESAWEEYRAARRRVNLNEFVRHFKAELAKLAAGDRDEVLRQIVEAA
jgi:hypothetical protein